MFKTAEQKPHYEFVNKVKKGKALIKEVTKQKAEKYLGGK